VRRIHSPIEWTQFELNPAAGTELATGEYNVRNLGRDGCAGVAGSAAPRCAAGNPAESMQRSRGSMAAPLTRAAHHQLCSAAGEFLGFFNRTCSAGTSTSPAGPGVGPGLRAASTRWTTFTVTVLGAAPGGGVLATLTTFVADGASQPLCVGNLVAEKAGSCTDRRAHVHPVGQAGATVPWVLRPVGNGAFTIAYTGRAAGCAVFLTAPASCGATALALAPASGSARQRWQLAPAGPSAR
jgi:hypothetical protein